MHSEAHTLAYGTDMLTNAGATSGAKLCGKLSQLSCGGLGVDSDTYWNDRFTGVAARTAVGSVVELATKVIVSLFFVETQHHDKKVECAIFLGVSNHVGNIPTSA